MGIFSGSKQVDISSVLYNLAGGPEQRVKYLPTTVITKIISNSQFSLSDVMTEALLKGPGIRMRSYSRWARESGYANAIGLQPSGIYTGNNISLSALAASIPHAVNETVAIQQTDIGSVDFSWWADQWMFDNQPELALKPYHSEYSPTTGLIKITTQELPQQIFTFAPTGMISSERYLYFVYTITTGSSLGPLIPGTPVNVGSPSEFPSTVDWTYEGNTPSSVSGPLVTTVTTTKSYSDGRPNEVTVSTSSTGGSYTNSDNLYTYVDYKGRQPDGTVLSQKSFMHLMVKGVVGSDTSTTTSSEVVEGVTITTKVDTTVESYKPTYSYRIDNQNTNSASQSNLKIIIYRYGTGNATYDAMFTPPISGGDFFAPIPLRLNNQFIGPDFIPDLYARNKRAYKKAVNSSYDKLIANIADNPSIGDIDYAYVQFGVPLNTKENASKKYIYKFMQALIAQTGTNLGNYNAWRVQWEIADNSQRDWLAWSLAQSDPSDPLYGTTQPTRIPYPRSVDRRITVLADPINFNMRISWTSMVEVTGTGLGFVGAKKGDVIFELGASQNYNQIVNSGGGWDQSASFQDYLTVTWQDGDNTWRSIGANGFMMFNTIYDGWALINRPSEAFADPDDSSFIVPLQDSVFRSMSLKDASQMGMASAYVVFNCYAVNKRRWYQSGLFNVILVIVIIIVSVLTGGAGASTAGLLGTAASVGATLGFTGLIAIIVGTVANAIAAIILAQILTAGASALFGDQIGQIVGTLASIIAVNMGSSMAAGKGFAATFGQLGTAENLLKLTAAAGKGYNDFINNQTSSLVDATNAVASSFEKASKKIQELYKTNLGVGINRTFNPMDFLQATRIDPFIPESSSAFLSRTLLTGSDIANMTNGMLTNFAQITISTQLPT